ncbi:hypothetical protein [Leptospira ryugenii]|nr:hypothetical protein [Leptospira ryugenii]
MSKKVSAANEFYVKCPLYTKGLKECPSSKNRLQAEDMETLTSHCLSEKYKACQFFERQKEQAA